MTSANLNIHLSEKWPKWLRTGSLRAFDGRIARSSSFSSFRVEGDHFDPPPPWRRWLRPPPGRGLNGLSPSPQRFQFLTSVYPGFSVSGWFRRPLLGHDRWKNTSAPCRETTSRRCMPTSHTQQLAAAAAETSQTNRQQDVKAPGQLTPWRRHRTRASAPVHHSAAAFAVTSPRRLDSFTHCNTMYIILLKVTEV